MHELQITQHLIELILTNSSKLKQINEITLDLGELTSYKKEPVIFYFDLLKPKHNKLSSASLLINIIPNSKDFILKDIIGK